MGRNAMPGRKSAVLVIAHGVSSTAAGRGAITVEGRMIDAASLRMAQSIVARVEAIATREG